MIPSPFSLACNCPREERWWPSHCQLGAQLRSSQTCPGLPSVQCFGNGYCTQDVTSAQAQALGGVGIVTDVSETEEIWEVLLRQGWKAAERQCCPFGAEEQSRGRVETKLPQPAPEAPPVENGVLQSSSARGPGPPWAPTTSVSLLVILATVKYACCLTSSRGCHLPRGVLSSLCCCRWWWKPTRGKHGFLVPPSSLSLCRVVH